MNLQTDSDIQLFKHIFPAVVLSFDVMRPACNDDDDRGATAAEVKSTDALEPDFIDHKAECIQLTRFKADDWTIEINSDRVYLNLDRVARSVPLKSSHPASTTDCYQRILDDMTPLDEVFRESEEVIVVTSDIVESDSIGTSQAALYALYVNRGVGMEYIGLYTQSTLQQMQIRVTRK